MLNSPSSKQLLTLLLTLTLAMASSGCSEESSLPSENEQRFVLPEAEGNWILVDQIHTTKQNPDMKLKRDNYNYQGMHGYHRLFKRLEANGYPYSQLVYTEADERLTPSKLEGFKVLFINLVSDDRPDFTADEIDTIVEWVRGGGGLFIIADHTNVYYHAERINPILAPMGIEVLFHTALDRSSDHSITGGAWLKIRNWDRAHPISQGIEIASFQTGGPMLTTHGVAFLSEAGFGDYWQENPDDAGFYGNWNHDPGEPEGELPLVAAAPFGEGRVAVVGDQNIFGDEWVMVANNLELALNTFEWLAKNEDTPTPLRDTRDEGHYNVGFALEQSEWNIGINACSGYFPFFINFNRTADITARGILSFKGEEDALVFTNPSIRFTEGEMSAIDSYLDAGKPLVVVADVTRAQPGTIQLLEELVPEFSLSADGNELGLADLPLGSEQVTTIESDSEFPTHSVFIDTVGMAMSGHSYPAGARCPSDVADSTPYMRAVTANFGDPFLQTELPDGSIADIARRVERPSGGQIIVFLQDGFWRNETLGKERQMPTDETRDAHHIQYNFLDWLMKQGPGALP